MCVLFFVAAQTFQSLAYWLWIPAASNPQAELLTYLLRTDHIRAWAIMSTILLLIVPYAVIAMGFRRLAPLASVLGLIFAVGFIGFEVSIRSIDYFVVGQHWARQLQAATDPAEQHRIVENFALWNDVVRACYFPLLLTYLLSSCAFAIATWRGTGLGELLGPCSFALNALRLLGRLLSTFAGQAWLNAFSDSAYFPLVLVVNLMLTVWLFHLAKQQAHAAASQGYKDNETPQEHRELLS